MVRGSASNVTESRTRSKRGTPTQEIEENSSADSTDKKAGTSRRNNAPTTTVVKKGNKKSGTLVSTDISSGSIKVTVSEKKDTSTKIPMSKSTKTAERKRKAESPNEDETIEETVNELAKESMGQKFSKVQNKKLKVDTSGESSQGSGKVTMFRKTRNTKRVEPSEEDEDLEQTDDHCMEVEEKVDIIEKTKQIENLDSDSQSSTQTKGVTTRKTRSTIKGEVTISEKEPKSLKLEEKVNLKNVMIDAVDDSSQDSSKPSKTGASTRKTRNSKKIEDILITEKKYGKDLGAEDIVNPTETVKVINDCSVKLVNIAPNMKTRGANKLEEIIPKEHVNEESESQLKDTKVVDKMDKNETADTEDSSRDSITLPKSTITRKTRSSKKVEEKELTVELKEKFGCDGTEVDTVDNSSQSSGDSQINSGTTRKTRIAKKAQKSSITKKETKNEEVDQKICFNDSDVKMDISEETIPISTILPCSDSLRKPRSLRRVKKNMKCIGNSSKEDSIPDVKDDTINSDEQDSVHSDNSDVSKSENKVKGINIVTETLPIAIKENEKESCNVEENISQDLVTVIEKHLTENTINVSDSDQKGQIEVEANLLEENKKDSHLDFKGDGSDVKETITESNNDKSQDLFVVTKEQLTINNENVEENTNFDLKNDNQILGPEASKDIEVRDEKCYVKVLEMTIAMEEEKCKILEIQTCNEDTDKREIFTDLQSQIKETDQNVSDTGEKQLSSETVLCQGINMAVMNENSIPSTANPKEDIKDIASDDINNEIFNKKEHSPEMNVPVTRSIESVNIEDSNNSKEIINTVPDSESPIESVSRSEVEFTEDIITDIKDTVGSEKSTAEDEGGILGNNPDSCKDGSIADNEIVANIIKDDIITEKNIFSSVTGLKDSKECENETEEISASSSMETFEKPISEYHVQDANIKESITHTLDERRIDVNEGLSKKEDANIHSESSMSDVRYSSENSTLLEMVSEENCAVSEKITDNQPFVEVSSDDMANEITFDSEETRIDMEDCSDKTEEVSVTHSNLETDMSDSATESSTINETDIPEDACVVSEKNEILTGTQQSINDSSLDGDDKLQEEPPGNTIDYFEKSEKDIGECNKEKESEEITKKDEVSVTQQSIKDTTDIDERDLSDDTVDSNINATIENQIYFDGNCKLDEEINNKAGPSTELDFASIPSTSHEVLDSDTTKKPKSFNKKSSKSAKKIENKPDGQDIEEGKKVIKTYEVSSTVDCNKKGVKRKDLDTNDSPGAEVSLALKIKRTRVEEVGSPKVESLSPNEDISPGDLKSDRDSIVQNPQSSSDLCSESGPSGLEPEVKRKSTKRKRDENEPVSHILESPEVPIRMYLDRFVPFLLEGLLKIAYRRPDDPIQYLADWMNDNKEAAYSSMNNENATSDD